MDEWETVFVFVYILYLIVEAVRVSETQHINKRHNYTMGKSNMCASYMPSSYYYTYFLWLCSSARAMAPYTRFRDHTQ
jgi:hypothetical protein